MAQDKSSTKEALLSLLCEHTESFLSGQRLAGQLGVSRTAVWKAVNALKKEGWLIDSVTNRGYRLSSENNRLLPALLKAKIKEDVTVICYDTVDSTNTEAKRLLLSGRQDRMLLVAEEQTAGRGRQGKSFFSPKGTGIYMSLVLHPQVRLSDAVTATTAAAVAVCRAIEQLTDKKPKIKWVNDVYLGNKKICGILTEAVTDFETQQVSAVIIGIGMNVRTLHFPPELTEAASLMSEVSRNDLIAAITNELLMLAGCDVSAFIGYYKAHSMLLGQSIRFTENGSSVPATVLDIDSNGGLVVRLETGAVRTLTSGEITVRGQR